MTAAFYLSKKAPGLPVTIYESSSRLGGWIRTKSIETKGGRVLFESGPRTIRTSGDSFLVTLDMVGSPHLTCGDCFGWLVGLKRHSFSRYANWT